MRSRAFLLSSTILGCALGLQVAVAQETGLVRRGFVPGEFVVQFEPHVDASQIGTLLANSLSQDAEVTRTFDRLNAVVLRVAEADEPQAFRSLQSEIALSPAVKVIEPNYLYYGNETKPDDPRLDEMWHIAHVGLPVAWGFQSDSPNVVVAVIDTGVMLDHEDLKGNIWTNSGEIPGNGLDDDANGFEDDVHGWDFFNDDDDPSPDLVPELILGLFPHPTRKEYEAHGSHVSGSIAAVGNNSTGVSGVSWRAQIMPLKFLGGAEGSGTLANAIAAIEYAVANNARIINASWGGGPESQLLRAAIETANNAGILFIAAAGNGGSDGVGDDNDQAAHFPANYDVPNVVSVAATMETDALTSFSNFGHTTVDIGAPGAAILSTVPTGNEASTSPGSGYDAFNGTSMATPIVSGVAALLMARFPDFSHLEVKELLLGTVDKVDALAGKVATGGRLNAGSSVGDQPLPAVIAQQMDALPAEERQLIEDNVKALSPATLGRLQAQAPALQNQRTADAQRYDFVVDLGTEVEPREIEQQLAPLDIVSQSKVRIPNRNVYEFTVESELPAEQVLETVRTTPGFEKAEPNFELKAD